MAGPERAAWVCGLRRYRRGEGEGARRCGAVHQRGMPTGIPKCESYYGSVEVQAFGNYVTKRGKRVPFKIHYERDFRIHGMCSN